MVVFYQYLLILNLHSQFDKLTAHFILIRLDGFKIWASASSFAAWTGRKFNYFPYGEEHIQLHCQVSIQLH